MHRLRQQLARLRKLAVERDCIFLLAMVNSQLAGLELHIAQDPDAYTLQDLIRLHRQGAATPAFRTLAKLVAAGKDHVGGCATCSSRTQYCALCLSDRLLFTFDIEHFQACQSCGKAYHRACWM